MSFAEIFGNRPKLSCGVVCVTIHLAVSAQHPLVTDDRTDRQTDIRQQRIPALASVARVKIDQPNKTHRTKMYIISVDCCKVEYNMARHVTMLLWSPYVIGQTIIFSSCSFFLLSIFFFSSPNLSGCRLDVYHTLTHGVALVRI